MQKLEYRLQRQDSLRDYVIDLRPEHHRQTGLPQTEITVTLDKLDMVVEAIINTQRG